MNPKTILCFIITLSPFGTMAQRIDNISSLFRVNDSIYGLMRYDNDLFQGKDNYYTQGISIDYVHPSLQKNPLNFAFIHLPSFNKSNYGLEIAHSTFTPTSIKSDSVFIGDRPFAAVLTLGCFKTSSNAQKKRQIASQLDFGIIGPAAFGKEMQTGIHRWTNNDLPQGWQHQIRNAPVINYGIQFEQQLFAFKSLFSIAAKTRLTVGTSLTNAQVGMDLHFGQKNTLYSQSHKKVQYYLYSQSSLKVIGFDASLMGGITNRNAYHLDYTSISSFVGEQHFGIVFTVPHFYLGIDFGFISKEIKQGQQHGWGGIRIGFN